MRKILQWLTVYAALAIIMLVCMTAFADTITTVEWETNMGAVTLADTADGTLSAVGYTRHNTVKVTFAGETADYASLIIVPVTDGVPEEMTPENIVLAQQQEILDGTATFHFYLKPSITEGVYAMYASGTGTEYVIKYFKVKTMNYIESILWETELGAVDLSNTPSGKLSAIQNGVLNTVTVAFAGENVGYASLIIVPVINGVAETLSAENIVLAQQQPITDGNATFNFYLKPSVEDGVYAMYAGGTNAEYEVKYFMVGTRYAPDFKGGEILQYDEYKNNIILGFHVGGNVDFIDWAGQKNDMKVTLSVGAKTAEISPENIEFDVENKTICINMQNYQQLLPAFDTVIDGNIQTAKLAITTPGYWVGDEFGGTLTGSFGMTAPKFSAKGFAEGVDFEIELYSETALSGANAIIALYDDGTLVDCMLENGVDLEAGETKTILLTLQSKSVRESGKLSLKVMLWDRLSAQPFTSFVVFPM